MVYGGLCMRTKGFLRLKQPEVAPNLLSEKSQFCIACIHLSLDGSASDSGGDLRCGRMRDLAFDVCIDEDFRFVGAWDVRVGAGGVVDESDVESRNRNGMYLSRTGRPRFDWFGIWPSRIDVASDRSDSPADATAASKRPFDWFIGEDTRQKISNRTQHMLRKLGAEIEIIGFKIDFYFDFDFEPPRDRVESKLRSNRNASHRFDHSMSNKLDNRARGPKPRTPSIETTS